MGPLSAHIKNTCTVKRFYCNNSCYTCSNKWFNVLSGDEFQAIWLAIWWHSVLIIIMYCLELKLNKSLGAFSILCSTNLATQSKKLLSVPPFYFNEDSHIRFLRVNKQTLNKCTCSAEPLPQVWFGKQLENDSVTDKEITADNIWL